MAENELRPATSSVKDRIKLFEIINSSQEKEKPKPAPRRRSANINSLWLKAQSKNAEATNEIVALASPSDDIAPVSNNEIRAANFDTSPEPTNEIAAVTPDRDHIRPKANNNIRTFVKDVIAPLTDNKVTCDAREDITPEETPNTDIAAPQSIDNTNIFNMGNSTSQPQDNFSNLIHEQPNTENADAEVTFNMLDSVHRNNRCTNSFFRVEITQTENAIKEATVGSIAGLGNINERSDENEGASGGPSDDIGYNELRPYTTNTSRRNVAKHDKSHDHIEDYQIIIKKLFLANNSTCVICGTRTMDPVRDSDKKILMYHCSNSQCSHVLGADDLMNYYDLVPVLSQALCDCGTSELQNYQFSVRNGKKELMCKNCDKFIPHEKQPCCVEIACYCETPGIDNIMLYWTNKDPVRLTAISCDTCDKFALVAGTFVGTPGARLIQLKKSDAKKESLSSALDSKGVPFVVAALEQADSSKWVDTEAEGSDNVADKECMPLYVNVKAGLGANVNPLGFGELRPAMTAMYGVCTDGDSLLSSITSSMSRNN